MDKEKALKNQGSEFREGISVRGGGPMSFYLGQLSDFCVFGFAFLSGYVHMMQFDQAGYYKRRLKGLLSVFCSYWLILVVFSIVGITIGQGDYMPGSLKKFILNALKLSQIIGL